MNYGFIETDQKAACININKTRTVKMETDGVLNNLVN